MSVFTDLIDFGISKTDLEAKLADVEATVADTKKRLDSRNYVLEKMFLSTMRLEEIPLNRWGEYWDLYEFVFNGSIIQKLKKQEEELDNIATAIGLLDVDKDKALDIERARTYPIEKILRDVKIVGNKKWVKCPFHSENTASFMVNEKNVCHCFSCGFHGDVISLFQKLNNLPFWEAIRRLQ